MEIIRKDRKVPLDSCYEILNIYEKIAQFEPNVIEIDSPVCLVADMHGQLLDVINIIDTVKGTDHFNRFLFLGDYVDRGDYSVETFIYLCCNKIVDPDNFFMIRGNHETSIVNSNYGLEDSCTEEYHSKPLFYRMNEVFQSIPLCAVIGDKIFCTHAGLSPSLKTIEDICLLDRYTEIPGKGPLCDLVWSDPREDCTDWIESQRGAGYEFGKKNALEFLTINGLEKIVRAHEVQESGYRWFFNETLLSLWSAPKYSECPTSRGFYALVHADCNIELKEIQSAK